MGSYSKVFYPTTATTGSSKKMLSLSKIYDNDAETYAYYQSAGKAHAYITGFGISIPSNATLTSIVVHTKVYGGNSDAHIIIRLLSNLDTSSSDKILANTEIVKGANFSAQYVVQTYTAEQLTAKLTEVDLHNGDIYDFLGNLCVDVYAGGQASFYISEVRIYDCYVVVNYSVPDIVVTTSSSPAEGGTVSGGGTYESGTTVTATATANSGYKFSYWLVNGANVGNANPISGALTEDTTVVAVFEKSGVNNIYIGNNQPTAVYIGTTPVKEIYIGNVLVYQV